jgi:LPS export ABC transporter protein LptC
MIQSRTAIGFFTAAVLFLWACENNPEEVKALTRKVQLAEEGRNVKALFSQTAHIKAYLTAPQMLRVRADTIYAEFPKSIHVDFYKEDNSLESVVQAKYGKYFEALGKVFLRDSVLVYNLTGDTLRCNTLWWDQNLEMFYTTDSVTVKTIAQQLTGTGFRAKSNLTAYTIDNTKGIVALPDQLGNAAPPAPDSSKPVIPNQQ